MWRNKKKSHLQFVKEDEEERAIAMERENREREEEWKRNTPLRQIIADLKEIENKYYERLDDDERSLEKEDETITTPEEYIKNMSSEDLKNNPLFEDALRLVLKPPARNYESYDGGRKRRTRNKKKTKKRKPKKRKTRKHRKH